jgi:pyruvate dehydrogenase E2 component (dihydrolipoamide acetyltransferase)
VATKVVMEALSPTMEEGRLVAWRKKEGDAVHAGDTLAEVETDKAVMELVARSDGVLRRIVLGEGTTVPVGALVGVIGAADEDISAIAGGNAPASGAPAAALAAPRDDAGRTARSARTAPDAATGDRSAAAPGAAPISTAPPAAAAPAPAPLAAPAGRVFASPLARRMASERGLDLRGVAGSGPGGRVVKRDVEAAGAQAPEQLLAATPGAMQAERAVRPAELPGAATAAGAPAAGAASAPMAPPGGYTDVPLTQIRKTIAKRLVQSLGPVPHFFLTRDIDMERAAEARGHLKALGEQYAVSFNDLVVKAVALALRKHPAVNASFLEDRIRFHGDVHVGMAVAVEDGLITPVIRHADRKGLAEIAAESRALAEKARARRLLPEEYTGATFSVSNLGMLDIDAFTAVINPPEAAILAVGRVAERPAVVDGAVSIRRLMRVTLSCDHRVVDGATGARFLQTLALLLENPLAMLL